MSGEEKSDFLSLCQQDMIKLWADPQNIGRVGLQNKLMEIYKKKKFTLQSTDPSGGGFNPLSPPPL